jgi:hypothetical protein
VGLAVAIPIRGVLAASRYEAKIFTPPVTGRSGALDGNLRHGGGPPGSPLYKCDPAGM